MRASAWRICLCLMMTVVVVVPPLVFANDPPDPQWTSSGCRDGYSHCANVTTKKSWSGSDEHIYFSVEAMFNTGVFTSTNLTVWYVGENFDKVWARNLQQGGQVHVVHFFPRGGDLAYPQITCKADYYGSQNWCWPNASCAKEIAKSGINPKDYSIAETAADLAWVLRKLGALPMQNVIVAEGLGSFVVQEMLQSQGKITNLRVIMAGFAHPQYFDTFWSFFAHDEVMTRVLSFCESGASIECMARVGAIEGMWGRLVNVMAAAEVNMLKCNKLLTWGVKPEEMHREYRAVLAAMLRQPVHLLMPTQRKLAQLIPSFIYRLQRCNDRDISALNKLYAYIKEGPQDECPSMIPQRYNWLVNDLMRSTPVDPTTALHGASRLHVILPNITTVQALYDFYEAYPKYKIDDRTITSTDVPVLLLFSDVDPMFSWGVAALAATVYASAERRFLPFQTALPVSTTASDCIMKNIQNIRQGHGWLDASQCVLPPESLPDMIGIDAFSYYGRKEAWEFTVPNMPEHTVNPGPTSTTSAPIPTPSEECSNKGLTVLAVFFVISLLVLIVLSYKLWKKTRNVYVSDDFYSNLGR